MAFSFQGLDPVLRLQNKLNIPISADASELHPVLRIAGIIGQTGPTLDYAVEMRSMPYENGVPTIVMVGCGGTGSHLLPSLLQYAWGKAQASNLQMPHFIIIDGDEVEDKNLIRQKFTPQDLGMSKAEALASRYSAAFGLKITAVNKYLTSSLELERIVADHGSSAAPVILVGAVDNHRARAVLYDYYLGRRYPTFWVDAGNEAWHGQVILGARNVYSSRGATSWENVQIGQIAQCVDLPCFFDVYPNEFLEIGGTPETPQNECALVVEEDPQTIHANMLSAQCAANLVTQILEGKIRTMSLNFDAKTGNVKAKHLTRQNIANGLLEQVESRKQITDFINGLCQIGNVDPADYFPKMYGATVGIKEANYIMRG